MSQARLYQHPLFYSFMNKICGYSLLLDEKQGRESIDQSMIDFKNLLMKHYFPKHSFKTEFTRLLLI